MKRKFLYALALLLCLSTVALSNERGRLWCRITGKTCPAAATHDTTAQNAAARQAMASQETNNSANHMFLRTFIKLLYI